LLYPILVLTAVALAILVTTLVLSTLDPAGSWSASLSTAFLWAAALFVGGALGYALGLVAQRGGLTHTARRASLVWVILFALLTVGYLVAFRYLPQGAPDAVDVSAAAAFRATEYLAIWTVGVPAGLAIGLRLVRSVTS